MPIKPAYRQCDDEKEVTDEPIYRDQTLQKNAAGFSDPSFKSREVGKPYKCKKPYSLNLVTSQGGLVFLASSS